MCIMLQFGFLLNQLCDKKVEIYTLTTQLNRQKLLTPYSSSVYLCHSYNQLNSLYNSHAC